MNKQKQPLKKLDTFKVHMNCTTPPSTFFDRSDLYLDLSVPKKTFLEGDIFCVKGIVKNLSEEHIPVPVALLKYSNGLDPIERSLDELTNSGAISMYYLTGNKIYLYWVELEPKQSIHFSFSFRTYCPEQPDYHQTPNRLEISSQTKARSSTKSVRVERLQK